MNIVFKNFRRILINSGPLLLLYYLSISDIEVSFENTFQILSFNIQLIIIYYWMLKDADILGSGHIFVAGLINDVVMGLPLGVSPISYLVVAFFASYVKNVTVNTSLFTDWFTFFLAVFFSNIVFLIFLINFTEIQVKYIDIFYNSFFTILFYPFFWLIFNIYKTMMLIKQDG